MIMTMIRLLNSHVSNFLMIHASGAETGICENNQRPLLLKWINFNPSMDKELHYKVWYEIAYPFPNSNGATVEVWKWISNFITHFTGHAITYPCWDTSWYMLVKGAQGWIYPSFLRRQPISRHNIEYVGPPLGTRKNTFTQQGWF